MSGRAFTTLTGVAEEVSPTLREREWSYKEILKVEIFISKYSSLIMYLFHRVVLDFAKLQEQNIK